MAIALDTHGKQVLVLSQDEYSFIASITCAMQDMTPQEIGEHLRPLQAGLGYNHLEAASKMWKSMNGIPTD